jgi:hypothetical protein
MDIGQLTDAIARKGIDLSATKPRRELRALLRTENQRRGGHHQIP